MKKTLFDRVEPIMGSIKRKEDFRKAAPRLDEIFDDPEIDTMGNDYFLLADLVLKAHKILSLDPESDRRAHLLRRKEVHERLLANPFSYLNPHGRIDSEFEIRHIELFLEGIERRVIVGQEGGEAEEAGEVNGDA